MSFGRFRFRICFGFRISIFGFPAPGAHGKSNTNSVVSALVVTSCRLSGVNATLRLNGSADAAGGGPRTQWRSSLPVAMSQHLSTLSAVNVMKRLPSGLTWQPRMRSRVGRQRPPHRALGDVGDLDLPLVAGGHERRAVGRDRYIRDADFAKQGPIAAGHHLGTIVLELPDADGAIGRTGGGELAVGAEGQRAGLARPIVEVEQPLAAGPLEAFDQA